VRNSFYLWGNAVLANPQLEQLLDPSLPAPRPDVVYHTLDATSMVAIDTTIVDPTQRSYAAHAIRETGGAADMAGLLKGTEYAKIPDAIKKDYVFYFPAFDRLGAPGTSAIRLMRAIAARASRCAAKYLSVIYMRKIISTILLNHLGHGLAQLRRAAAAAPPSAH
jgi:hypothetical protein